MFQLQICFGPNICVSCCNQIWKSHNVTAGHRRLAFGSAMRWRRSEQQALVTQQLAIVWRWGKANNNMVIAWNCNSITTTLMPIGINLKMFCFSILYCLLTRPSKLYLDSYPVFNSMISNLMLTFKIASH